jgi:hypothetical protein
MSCNNVQILNFNHNIVEVGSDNKLIITDNVRCNSITIPQPVTNILQINSPGPQGPVGPAGSGSFADTGSFATTGSNNFIGNQNISGSVIITGSLTVSGSSTFTNIGPAVFSGSVNVTQGITGSLFGTSSYALTASYVANASSFPYTGSAIITGSLGITGSFNVGNGSAKVNITNDGALSVKSNDPSQSINAVDLFLDSTVGTLNLSDVYGSGSFIFSPSEVIWIPSEKGNITRLQFNALGGQNTENVLHYPSTTGIDTTTDRTITVSINNTGSDYYGNITINTVPQAVTSSRPFSTTGSTIYTTSPSTIPPTHLGAILIGSLAGGGATAANYSIMMGNQAGFQAELSNDANFIGNQAGYQSTSSAYSNFIGPLAGYQAYSSPNSNFIGIRAGYLSTAPYSTYIGAYTGYLLQGYNNIILGTGISLPNNTSHSINLGGVIYATNTAFNTSVSSPTVNPVGGKVGINVLSPSYNFEVSGTVAFPNLITSSTSLTNVLMISSSGQLFITASSAIGGGSTVNTGSLLVTASASSNVITFTKGNASTFTITVATGSGGGASFPYTGSAVITGSLAITGSTSFYNLPSSPSESIVPVGVSAGTIYRIGSNVKIVPGTDPSITAPSTAGSEQSGYGIPGASVSSNTGVSTPYFRWYNTSSGGTLLQEGYSNTYLQYITASTTFYVSEFVYGNMPGTPEYYGEGPRSSALTATVAQPDVVTVVPSTTLGITNTPVVLSMDYTSYFNYYDYYTITAYPELGSGITNPYGISNGDYPALITITPTSPGTYTYTIIATDTSQGVSYLAAPVTIIVATNATASYAVTASYAMNGGGASTTKAGSGSVASFGGTPLTSSIIFTTPFTNNLYAVTVVGEDARPWTIQNKVSGSFVINSNSSVALSGPIYWVATPFNNS